MQTSTRVSLLVFRQQWRNNDVEPRDREADSFAASSSFILSNGLPSPPYLKLKLLAGTRPLLPVGLVDRKLRKRLLLTCNF